MCKYAQESHAFPEPEHLTFPHMEIMKGCAFQTVRYSRYSNFVGSIQNAVILCKRFFKKLGHCLRGKGIPVNKKNEEGMTSVMAFQMVSWKVNTREHILAHPEGDNKTRQSRTSIKIIRKVYTSSVAGVHLWMCQLSSLGVWLCNKHF